MVITAGSGRTLLPTHISPHFNKASWGGVSSKELLRIYFDVLIITLKM
jgi:hypothetical protein